MIDRIDSWLPDWLEQLDECLTQRLGEHWWDELGLDPPRVLP